MGITERKARERQERRDLFVDVAERLFFERGYEGTSVDLIARQAEFSKRTVYLYFADKREVFLAVVLRALERLNEDLKAAVRGGGNGSEKLISLARTYFRFARRFPQHFEVILSFEAQEYRWGRSKEGLGEVALACFEVNDRNTELVHGSVLEGMEDDSVHTRLDPAQFTLLVWGQTVGILQVLAMREDTLQDLYNLDPEDFFDAFIESLALGVAGPRWAKPTTK